MTPMKVSPSSVLITLGTMTIALTAAIAPAGAEPITTESLLREMVDLRRFADFPQPAYKTVQFSSYDHRSTLPDGPDWFANSDGFGGEPVPNFEKVLKAPEGDGPGEYLICDVQGPGAIVRFWTAAISGHLRMYLDGDDQPVFGGTAEEFFFKPVRAYAKDAGIDEAEMAEAFYQRNAAYFPIPFAKRCRVVWIGKVKDIHFYQLQIRLYDQSADVRTFTPADLKTCAAAIRDLAKVLKDPDANWKHGPGMKEHAIDATIKAASAQDVLTLEGSGMIEQLSLAVEAGILNTALRQTLLRVVCDDFPSAQVESPVGDFFGAAPGVNPYVSVPFTVTPDGLMTSRFVMPYGRKIRIIIDNRGRQPVRVKGSAVSSSHPWNDDRSMYFYARWRVDHGVTGDPANVIDLPFVIAAGQGVYVGTTSLLMNPNPIPTPGGNWWGEGDEKIFVDDDRQPSTFGTGSEDYYNYAWSSPDIWITPYAGQPRNDGPANRGFVTNYRWHILDPLPFRERIAFYMELYPHERTEGFSYARLSYLYARPGMMDDHVPVTGSGDDVRLVRLPANWEPAARGAAGRSTFLQAETLLPEDGRASTTLRKDRLFAGEQILVWSPSGRDDALTLNVPIPEDGTWTLKIVSMHSGDSGEITLDFDGESAGFGGGKNLLNLNAPHRVYLREHTGKTLDLKKGTYPLTIRPAGDGDPPREVGIDFIWLQRRK